MRLRGNGHRRGAGAVLFIVIAVAFFLLVVGLSQSFFGREVGNKARRAAVGGVCEDLAESALANAYWVVATETNRSASSTPYYDSFRKNIGSFDVEVPWNQLDYVKKAFDRLPDYVLSGAGVKGRVLYQLPFGKDPVVEDERFGTLQLEAIVRHKTTGVRRRVTNCYGFKKALTTVGRPFDFLTFAVIYPTRLLNTDVVPSGVVALPMNTVIEKTKESLDKLKEGVKKDIAEFDKGLKEARGKPGAGQVVAMLERAKAMHEDLLANWPKVKVVPPAQAAQGDSEQVHTFPTELMISTAADEVDLATLRVNLDAQEKRKQIIQGDKDMRAAHKRLNDAMKSQNMGAANAAFDDYHNAIRAMVRGCESLLKDVVKTWQDKLNETGNPKIYGELKRAFQKFNPKEMLRKTFIALEEGDPYGIGDKRGINDKFKDLLAKKIRPYSGVLSVLNTKTTLDVDSSSFTNGAFAGRAVIYVDGNLRLSNVRVEDPGKHLLTFVCRNKLTVDGRVQANLVALGDFQNPASATIEGSLILRTLNFKDRMELTNALNGKVKRNPRTASGPESGQGVPTGTIWRDYVTIALGPEVIFKKIGRK